VAGLCYADKPLPLRQQFTDTQSKLNRPLPVPDAVVQLLQRNTTNVISHRTDANGVVRFTDVGAGTYYNLDIIFSRERSKITKPTTPG